MGENTIRVAFYGKGGIGKSTIASNVSAALACGGNKVLHIGCDPKADSTRCLAGRRIPTVLQQLERLGDEGRREDYLFPGAVEGVFCVEAGGPRAGRGCAGMGITSMETELERLGILREDWDVIVYDVLGDVVCGGFAVPMRRNFVDAVFIVSSSDFMSVYAANNILKAVVDYSSAGKNLLGGLVWNHCRSEWDRQAADSFAQMTGAPILCRVEESEEIKWNDYRGTLLVKERPGSQPARAMRELADYMVSRDWAAGDCEKPFSACTEEKLEAWKQKLLAQRTGEA